MDATQLLTRRCDLPPLRFENKVHGALSVNQTKPQQQIFLPPMSRRPGSGHSHHIPQNVPEDIPRDDRRPPPPHLARYVEHPSQPTTPHSRSDAPHYIPYQVPTSRVSYAPDPRHPAAEPRHPMHVQRHMELSRSHERGVVYPRPGEYYPPEAPIPPIHQPAPRQRTAVACRYCRRRKVNFSIL